MRRRLIVSALLVVGGFPPPACSFHQPSASGSVRSWRSSESWSWLLVAVPRPWTMCGSQRGSSGGHTAVEAAAPFPQRSGTQPGASV